MIEMVIVIAITAILLATSMTAYIAAKDDQNAYGLAEQMKSDFRKAQNRAIATYGECQNSDQNHPKMWGIRIDQSGYDIAYYCADVGREEGGWAVEEEPKNPGQSRDFETRGVDVSIKNADTNASLGSVNYVYSAPFVKVYSFSNPPFDPSSPTSPEDIEDKEGAPAGIGGDAYCPVARGTTGPCINERLNAKITISYKGQSYKLNINGITGTVSIQ